jgi:hypothetical protein
VFSGYYAKRFERSDFRPAGSKEVWWLTHDAATKGLLDGCVYVVVRGTLSPKGRYGHLGAYDREISALEILESRTLGPDEKAGLSNC